MKKLPLLLSVAVLGASLAPVAALAGSEGSCSACKSETAAPVPVAVVSPSELPRSFRPGTVEVELTIDEKGMPRDVKTLGFVDRNVSQRVIAAVSQWRFTPRQVNGQAVAGRFVLPIEIVEGA